MGIVILNEVKNLVLYLEVREYSISSRILHGEILHFVQNDKGEWVRFVGQQFVI